MNKVEIAAWAILLLLGQNLCAQVYNYEDGEGPVPPDSVKGIYFGLNLGFYFANNNTAKIYNGSGYSRDGFIITTFEQTWLYQALVGTPQAEDRSNIAFEGVRGIDWDFLETDNRIRNMDYSPAFMVGGHIRYMFNSDFGIFAELNGTKLVTVGQYLIRDLRTNPDPSQNMRVRPFGIRGEEQRIMINLGAHKILGRAKAEKKGKSPIILPYIDFGLTTTFLKFDANVIDLGELGGSIDLTAFYNIQGGFQNQANLLTGVGFGGIAGLGAQITLGRKFTIDFGYTANLQQTQLGELNEIGFQHQIVLKAIYM